MAIRWQPCPQWPVNPALHACPSGKARIHRLSGQVVAVGPDAVALEIAVAHIYWLSGRHLGDTRSLLARSQYLRQPAQRFHLYAVTPLGGGERVVGTANPPAA